MSGSGAAQRLPAEQARLDAVRWVGEAIVNLDTSFDRITRLLSRLTGAPVAAFSLLGAEGEAVPSAFGLDADQIDAAGGAEGDAFARASLAADALLVVADARTDFRFADAPTVTGPPYVRFYAGLPVRAPNGQPVGTLCVLDTSPRELDGDAVAAFHDLRDTLEEMVLLRTLSVRDTATGLVNRRLFDELLEREWRRSVRAALPLTVMTVDIDHLAAYNDTCGAQAGEHALKAVAAAVQECFRRGGDVVARMGGAAFAVLLPDTDPAAAALMAERCRTAVSELDLEHPDSPAGALTVSLGVATGVPDQTLGVDVVLRAAVGALALAKRAGRDRASIVRLDAEADANG